MVTQAPDGTAQFRFYRPEAEQVSIAGEFNDWQPCFLMNKQPDGWWHCQMSLGVGAYKFMYVADGQWYADYAAFGLEPGPFGWNSVVRIEPPMPSSNEDEDAEADLQAA